MGRFFTAFRYALDKFLSNFKKVYNNGKPKGVLVECFGSVSDDVPNVIHKHMIGDDLSFVFGPIFYAFMFNTFEDLDNLHLDLKSELSGKTDGFWLFKEPEDDFFHYYNKDMRQQFTGYRHNVNISTVSKMIKQINYSRNTINRRLGLLHAKVSDIPKTPNHISSMLTNEEKVELLNERNNILDKINMSGYDSLTPYQKQRLDYLSELDLNN